MKNSAFRSKLQRLLTHTGLLPAQSGRPSGKVMHISDLPGFRSAGQTLVSEPAFKLPPLREHGPRVCNRIVQQESIPARDFYSIRLQDTHVFGPSVMVVTVEGTVICEVSKEWGVYLDAPEASWIQRRFFLPKPHHLPGRSFLLASTGGETFNHWMMECLPRLALAEKAGISFREIDHWLVSRKSPPFVRETLGRFGIPWERVVDLKQSQHCLCESLELVSLGGDWGMPSALAVEFLQRAFPAGPKAAPSRIYLRRGHAKDRRVRDEEALVSALAREGFQALDCGTLGVCQTAAELSRAECIVAPHGAALSNMVFAPPGCRVVEIFNPSFTNPCYRMLAGRCAHSYSALYARPQHHAPNPAADASGHITVDPIRVLESIRQI